jgi:hypothetical protein
LANKYRQDAIALPTPDGLKIIPPRIGDTIVLKDAEKQDAHAVKARAALEETLDAWLEKRKLWAGGGYDGYWRRN